jgi:hypothetical protein
VDYDLRSLTQAFEDADYAERHEDFRLFAFILATTADTNVLPGLLPYLFELDEMTGKVVLIIAPRVERADGTVIPKAEAAELLNRGVQPPGPGVDPVESDVITQFLKRVMKESYEIAARIQLKKTKLPGVAFFTSLEQPRKYVYWALKGQQPNAVVKDFRAIVEATEGSKRPLWAIRRQKLFRMTTVTLKQAPKLVGPAAGTAGKVLLPAP